MSRIFIFWIIFFMISGGTVEPPIAPGKKGRNAFKEYSKIIADFKIQTFFIVSVVSLIQYFPLELKF